MQMRIGTDGGQVPRTSADETAGLSANGDQWCDARFVAEARLSNLFLESPRIELLQYPGYFCLRASLQSEKVPDTIVDIGEKSQLRFGTPIHVLSNFSGAVSPGRRPISLPFCGTRNSQLHA